VDNVPAAPQNNGSIVVTETPHKHGVFTGRFGLRAGWGIAIFLIVLLVLSTLGSIFGLAVTGHLKEVMAARAFVQSHPHEPRPRVHIDFVPAFAIVSDAVIFFGLLGLCWFFSRGERRRLGVYGIGKNRLKDLATGAFWGLVMMSALVTLMHRTHVLAFDGRALAGASILIYGIKWLIAFACVGLAEEYMFRGYLQYTLMRGVWGLAERTSPTNPRPIAFWTAATIISLLFALAHGNNTGETHFGLVAVVLAGFLFSYALWRTGSLWWGIGFHMTWDWAQSFLYGVPDSGNVSVGRLFNTHPTGNPLFSGGPDGPEGSLFVCIAIALTIVVLRFTPQGMQPALEQGSLDKALPHEAPTSPSI
jgi:uncharacterized protein